MILKPGTAPADSQDHRAPDTVASNERVSADPAIPVDMSSTASKKGLPVANNLTDSSDELPRSGATDWEAAKAYYTKFADARELSFSNQPAKGSVCLHAMLSDTQQTGANYVVVQSRATQDRLLLTPDDPEAVGEKIPSGAVYQAIGRFEGVKTVEISPGVSESLPVLKVYTALTTAGFINFENRAAPRASTEVMTGLAAERNAKIEKQKEQREAEANQQKLAAEEAAKAARESKNHEKQQKTAEQQAAAARDLAKAHSDLDGVNASIESDRLRYQTALGVINTLTKNKTVPVTEGSPNYYKCLEASKVIGKIEEGAPALKAEKARLESLVSRLEAK